MTLHRIGVEMDSRPNYENAFRTCKMTFVSGRPRHMPCGLERYTLLKCRPIYSSPAWLRSADMGKRHLESRFAIPPWKSVCAPLQGWPPRRTPAYICQWLERARLKATG